MEYKPIGNTGIMVSSLCFGTMSFGGDADELISAAMFHRCREAGNPGPQFDTVTVAGEVTTDSLKPVLMLITLGQDIGNYLGLTDTG